MNPIVQYHFDFGSPNCYIAHKLIPGIEERTGVTIDYLPVLLGGIFKLTNNQPPMIKFQDVKGKNAYMRREMARFLKTHGLDRFRMNSNFPINTVQVMRGAIVAAEEDFLMPYVDVISAAIWEQDLKMDDPDVIAAALKAGGLDADLILRRIQEDGIKKQLVHNTSRAVEMGTFGCPFFYVGDEPYFGKDILRDMEEEILRQKNQASA
ncbi:2-hydroxychromene-2-carboxylate isomerase [Sneathiella chinensis]|uniref:2-hydroxychromene-2-carboxylate isomerase n=1 Tax=Sneathiella chinensis TaxID=349750 RepID=A0ABQ5UA01_9PROT|nr:2-hydroxychromene-2-carboxylate isomerase [Sneathiella chinensis]GLQ07346.1 2-hydroxychromene-2-carboxylate isomerase [Sneathiella chinensis]